MDNAKLQAQLKEILDTPLDDRQVSVLAFKAQPLWRLALTPLLNKKQREAESVGLNPGLLEMPPENALAKIARAQGVVQGLSFLAGVLNALATEKNLKLEHFTLREGNSYARRRPDRGLRG